MDPGVGWQPFAGVTSEGDGGVTNVAAGGVTSAESSVVPAFKIPVIPAKAGIHLSPETPGFGVFGQRKGRRAPAFSLPKGSRASFAGYLYAAGLGRGQARQGQPEHPLL